MDEKLKPSEQMLFSLATEMGLMSLLPAPVENETDSEETKMPALKKGAQVT